MSFLKEGLVRSRIHRGIASVILAIVILGGLQTRSDAADPDTEVDAVPPSGLTLQGVAAESGSYSSNPLMTTTPSKPLVGSTTSPEMIIKDITPRSTFGFDTRVDENVFNQSLYNSTDTHSNVNFLTKNDLWTFQVAQGTNYDTTRTSELSNFNLGPVVARHFGLSIAPQIAYAPTPVDSLSMAGSALRSEYDNNLFTNYETFAASPTYTHQFTPLDSGLITIHAQRYQTSPNANLRIDSIGPLVGWQTVLTPRLTANLSVGAQTTRQYQSNVAQTPWTWQSVYAGGVTFKGEQDIIDFESSRQQDPYGNGTEALQTTFTLTDKHKLNKVLTLNFGANYLTSTYQIITPGSLTSMSSANLGLTYHVTEQVDLTATYQYAYEVLADTATHPQNNSAVINLTYRPNIWSFGQ